MKNTIKRVFATALCVMLTVSLTVLPAGAADGHDHDEAHTHETIAETSAAPATDGVLSSHLEELLEESEQQTPDPSCEHEWEEKAEADTFNCVFGTSWIYYRQCKKCGMKTAIAYRPGDGSDAIPGGHTWGPETITDNTCPENPNYVKTCTVCGFTEVNWNAGHKWVKEGDPVPGETCGEKASQTYRCEYCNATKEEKVGSAGKHVFEEVVTSATCTEPGVRYERCTVCNFETDHIVVQQPLGHTWVDSADHTVHTCSVCGATTSATEHTWSDWKHDADNHWVECTECGFEDQIAAHTYNANGVCSVCGAVKPNCDHEWTVAGKLGSLYHKELCSICGETRTVRCGAETQPRTSCTDPVLCVCGNTVKSGQQKHIMGPWVCHDATHERVCRNTDCQYTESGAHTFTLIGGVMACSVCNMPSPDEGKTHEHTWGHWTAGRDGCVRTCTDAACGQTETQPHTPGEADCAGNASCVYCGAPVTTTPSAVHSGPTELRDYVAPEVGKEGYTGDTWCLTCGQISEKGTSIPALEPDHVHEFNHLNYDASGHWMECACGEHESEPVAHTGGKASCAEQAVCEVCGEKYGALDGSYHVGGTEIVNSWPAQIGVAGYTGDTHCLGCGALLERGTEIPPLENSHEHAYALKSDSLHHWMECACGDKYDVAAHDYENGVCTVCNAAEPEKVETHVHTFSAKWSANSLAHWHTCTVCGVESDVAEHIFIDGKCAGCGMSYFAYEQKTANEQSPKPPVTEVFADVAADPVKDYYVENIQRLYEAGIMSGSQNGKGEWIFDVDSDISHIEVQLVLARICGVEGTYGSDWDGVVKMTGDWAKENGFLSGDGAVSRQEMFYNLWKLAGSPKSTKDLSGFADNADVNAEYLDAIRWSVEVGIVTGSGEADGKLYLKPNADILRKDAATVVVRYVDAANIVI